MCLFRRKGENRGPDIYIAGLESPLRASKGQKTSKHQLTTEQAMPSKIQHRTGHGLFQIKQTDRIYVQSCMHKKLDNNWAVRPSEAENISVRHPHAHAWRPMHIINGRLRTGVCHCACLSCCSVQLWQPWCGSIAGIARHRCFAMWPYRPFQHACASMLLF